MWGKVSCLRKQNNGRDQATPETHVCSPIISICRFNSFDRVKVDNTTLHHAKSADGIDQVPVVERADNSIQQINHHPVDSVLCLVNIFPQESDFSSG